MPRNIYILRDKQLFGVQAAEYPKESDLQKQVSDFPAELIPGEQIDPDSPRRWLLIKREAGVPDAETAGSRWSVDHLFLDQDGIPTLVEVKRSSNNQIRREVVGQMLDYSANAVQFWTAVDGQRMFDEGKGEAESDSLLEAFMQGMQTPEEFWQKVKTNLQGRRIRMVFVADIIPAELQRIVEFLNAQMDPTEVLAVQIGHYSGTFDGKEIEALVPQVLGANVIKAGTSTEPKRKWTAEEFLTTLRENRGEVAAGIARKLLDWAKLKKLTLWWGEGKRDGSFFPMLVRGDGRFERFFTFCVWTYGAVEVQFASMLNRAEFSDEQLRIELMDRLNRIPGVALPRDRLPKRPSFPLEALADESALQTFLAVWDWYIEAIRGGDSGEAVQ